MTDEPIPPPMEDGADSWVEPPPLERERPRNPIGWIVSGALLLLLMFSAVAGYIDQPVGKGDQTALQNSLRYSVSLVGGANPAVKKVVSQWRIDGLKEVLKESTEKSSDSAEAARVAVVAARELETDPPEGAIKKLADSEGKVSQAMARIYSGEPSAKDVDAFVAMESDEYAVRLAKVQAQEMVGRDVDRGAIVDTSLLPKFMVFMFGGLGILVAGVVCLIAFFVLRSSGRIVPVGFGGLEKSDGDRLMSRFALCFFVLLGFGLAGEELYKLPAFDRVSELWFDSVFQIATFLFIVAMLRIQLLDRSDSFGRVVGEKKPFWKLVRAGAFGYLCAVPLLLVAVRVMTGLLEYLPDPTHPINEDIAVATRLDWVALALMAAVLAPLIEELAFRGLLFPALATQIRKPWVAMLACGFVFAAIHPQGPLMWPALATVGATAAALRYYTGSLIPSIVLHAIHNALILLISSING